MAATGSIRKLFPGGNTAEGFFSFYDYIIETDATRIMVIKGGPGVGKSTFMRRIAEVMVEKGYDVELHHCSSDNGSLDGVVIPAIRVALIDGTAPHVVDPKNPGCVDEIIHLGDYWDEAKMRAGKAQILRINREVGRSFARAYRYLKAAKAVHDDWETIYTDSLDLAAANAKAEALIAEIFPAARKAGVAGKQRHLFGSAITPDGPLNYLETVIEPMAVKYVIKGEPGTGKSTLLAKVVAATVTRGYDAEVFHCSLDPQRLDHVVIGELGVGLTVAAEPHIAKVTSVRRVIDMNECVDAEKVAPYSTLAAEDRRLCFELLDRAVAAVAQAKKLHDLMETYYVPHMDFAAINALREKILSRILAYAEEYK